MQEEQRNLDKKDAKDSPLISQQIQESKVQQQQIQILHEQTTFSSPNLLGQQKQQASKKQNVDLDEEKQKEYDRKAYKKKKGIYVLSSLEQAKKLLKDNGLELSHVIASEIWGQLTSEDQKKLKRFLRDQKRKCFSNKAVNSNSPQTKLNISEEQQNTISNININRIELISKELCDSQSIEDQVRVMVNHNKQNHPAILAFLKSLQHEPFENFFEVLIQVIEQTEDSSQQIRLLVGLCGLYNGQKISPTVDLCCSTLKYLANEDGVTSQQAIGFLKFALSNNGNIHQSELSDLLLFDQRHKQCFVGFKQWLQWTYHLSSDLMLVLPNSCYILGLPFAKMLKKKSKEITQQIPAEFLEIFIQILVFSFEKEKARLLPFLKMVQCGFLDLLEKITSTQLLNLFNGLLKEILTHNKEWYLNIGNSTRLIEDALTLVKENKVFLFDMFVCKDLLSNLSNIEDYLAKPSLIKKRVVVDEKQRHLSDIVISLNKNLTAQKFLEDFDLSLPLENLDIFVDVLQIKPHYIQELAMQILSQVQHTHTFLTIAPGLGKTKLILALAIHFVKQKPKTPVIILNTNLTLLTRDYEQAKASLEKINIECASTLWEQPCPITFLTTQNFIAQKDLPEKYHIILDEYQNIFFKEDLFDILGPLQKAVSFTGFSGSSLTHMQCKLLECCFPKQALVLQLTKPLVTEQQDEITVCKSQKHHIDTLAKISEQFKLQVPQIFILDAKTADLLTKKRKSQYSNLIAVGDSLKINTTLENSFNQRRGDGTFGTCIINEEMGTGTDFKTSTDIENSGGLVLVFGVKPSSISTFEQLSCRVGRIFNKGRRFYIINDSENYNECHKDYLKKQLNILRKKEDEFIRTLLNSVRTYWKDQGIVEDDEDSCSDDNSYESEDFVDKDDQQIEAKGPVTQKNIENDIEMVLINEEQKLDSIHAKQCTRCGGQVDGEVIHTCNIEMLKEVKQGQQIGKKRVHNLEKNLENLEKECRKEAQITWPTKRQKQILDNQQQQQQQLTTVLTSKEKIDKLYFEGYSRPKIHKEMIKDEVRVQLYYEAIQKTCKGMVVLDVGCGSGILSVQAINAGAIKVYAVDAADISEIMSDDFKRLIKEGKIEFIQSTIEKLTEEYDSSLMDPKIPLVDVIVSEWMGYFLLFENMVSSYMCAIKTFLKPDGIMIPSRAPMYLQIGSYETKIAKKYLEPAGKGKAIMIKQYSNQALLSKEAANIQELDFTDRNLENPLDCADGFTSAFAITASKAGIFNAFVGSFEVKLCDEIFLNTMPESPTTHWKQSIFFISNPIHVEIGDIIEGRAQVQADKDNHRNLIVKLSYKIEGKGSSKVDEQFTFE